MIRGTKTLLRALEEEDLPRCVSWFNDPELRRFLNMRYPLSMTEEERWWASQSQREGTDNIIFAIEAEDGTHIGNIGLHNVDHVNRRAMLGIAIGEKAYWGQGYGTDAIRATLGWAFGYLNLNRVYLTVYAHNGRAIRCYEKCGFQQEGIQRQAQYIDGRYVDEWMMSILRAEFLDEEEEG